MHPLVHRLPSFLAVMALAIPCSISACSASSPSNTQPTDDSGSGGDDAGGDGSSSGGGEAGHDGGGSGGGDGGGGSCAAGSKTGAKGNTDGLQTSGGLGYIVRVPPTYDPTVASPLIVFYAEYGTYPSMAAFEEMDTGLTPVAFSHGYIIAYTNTPDTHNGIPDADTVPDLISKRWCVDQKRMYATGNSDGGTMTFELAVNYSTYAAVAPSAAGADSPTIAMTPCPEAQSPAHTTSSAMVMHSEADGTFNVQWGRDQAKWFANCASCSSTATGADANGCISYPNCSNGRSVVYCEGNQPHADWPGNSGPTGNGMCSGPGPDCLNEPLLKFFDAHKAQ